jgi:hypothetical protein
MPHRFVSWICAFLLPAGLAAQTLTGVVYIDRNANGTRDAGEPGVAGAAVSDQDTVVLSASDGTFRINARATAAIVFVSVPDGHRAVGSFWRRAGDALSFGLAPTQRAREFTFVHASDTHISEQSAPRTRLLRAMVDSLRPAFLIITGDLVRDALRVGEAEARGYYELFMKEKGSFATPVHTVPGNHEIFGIERDKSGVSPTHPLFGKAMYRSYLGPEYYSFTHGGVHFVALNTADIHGSSYFGHVDSLQLAWLARDLARLPANTPVVTFNHIPFYSTSALINGYQADGLAPTLLDVNGRLVFRHVVSNAAAALDILARQKHVVALGGHVHIRELLTLGWKNGRTTRFENSAAVVGPAGPFPSGFTVYTVRDGLVDPGRFVPLP